MSKSQVRVRVALFVILVVALTSCAMPAAPAPAAPPVEKVVTQGCRRGPWWSSRRSRHRLSRKSSRQLPPPRPPAPRRSVNFWSQWSTQPLNQQFVSTVVADYLAAHPDVQINVSYWEKGALDSAMQAALTAGRRRAGYCRRYELGAFAKAGWLLGPQRRPAQRCVQGRPARRRQPDRPERGCSDTPSGFRSCTCYTTPKSRSNSASRCRPTTSSRRTSSWTS